MSSEISQNLVSMLRFMVEVEVVGLVVGLVNCEIRVLLFFSDSYAL